MNVEGALGLTGKLRGIRILLATAFIGMVVGSSHAFTWPWDTAGPWPTSSNPPVEPLPHPDPEPTRALPYLVAADGRIALEVVLVEGEGETIFERLEPPRRADT